MSGIKSPEYRLEQFLLATRMNAIARIKYRSVDQMDYWTVQWKDDRDKMMKSITFIFRQSDEALVDMNCSVTPLEVTDGKILTLIDSGHEETPPEYQENETGDDRDDS